jgi:hypothetical protein
MLGPPVKSLPRPTHSDKRTKLFLKQGTVTVRLRNRLGLLDLLPKQPEGSLGAEKCHRAESVSSPDGWFGAEEGEEYVTY